MDGLPPKVGHSGHLVLVAGVGGHGGLGHCLGDGPGGRLQLRGGGFGGRSSRALAGRQVLANGLHGSLDGPLATGVGILNRLDGLQQVCNVCFNILETELKIMNKTFFSTFDFTPASAIPCWLSFSSLASIAWEMRSLRELATTLVELSKET